MNPDRQFERLVDRYLDPQDQEEDETMSKPDSHYQHRRQNPNKPFVAKEDGIWWVRVVDLNNDYHCKIKYSLQEALTKAYEYAALVASQRTEATA